MKHFRMADGRILALESDGSQDELITEDMVPLSDEDLIILRAPTRDQVLAAYASAVHEHLNATVRPYSYDSILSACTYATSSVPKFQAEALACIAWRDAVWSSCYATIASVDAGEIPPPSIPELLASLPTLVWPT